MYSHRLVARNFLRQEASKSWAQILNSSERLNYLKTLQCTLKSNHPYQILIILARRCYVSLPIPYIGPSLSRGH